MSDDIRSYRFPDGYWKSARRQHLTRSLAGLVGTAALGAVGLLIWRRVDPASAPHRFDIFNVAPLCMLIVVFAFAMRRFGVQIERRTVSYQLTMSPNVMRTTMLDLLSTEVLRCDVTRIEERSDGLVVRYAGGIIGVPKAIEGYAEVRERLASWSPIVPRRAAALSGRVLFWVNMAGVAALYFDRTPVWICVAIDLSLIGFFGWVARVTLRTRLDAKQKARFVGPIALCILMFAMRLAYDIWHWVKR